ncbi:MAG: energy-coupling factor ABC transporter ATP-binding protein [Treponema sp.]|jgi:biotin transport system ATP-binding protein|nr:energy-coupling factor ABC transporter ATP-binding protein [Treponema sp.]
MDAPLFSVKNVSKIFSDPCGSGSFTALDGVSLDIFAGQCMVIAGSNGSGKTLLMRIIAGLLEPSGGDVLFRGRSLYGGQNRGRRRETEKALRGELGLVFQDADAQIVGETVIEDAVFGPENLGLCAADALVRADKALAALGLAEKRLFSPRRLSGGEKRRLAIAGTLAMGCNTIIMDEPFANLDWPGVVQTLGIIRDLKNEGKTLIILTHELEKILSLAGRLLILHRGVICNDGQPARVLDRLDPAWGVRDPRRNYTAVEDCTWLEH